MKRRVKGNHAARPPGHTTFGVVSMKRRVKDVSFEVPLRVAWDFVSMKRGVGLKAAKISLAY